MKSIGIIGAGNIGGAIAKGLLNYAKISASDIGVSRQKMAYQGDKIDFIINRNTKG